MSAGPLTSSIGAEFGIVEILRVMSSKEGQSISALPTASYVNLFGNVECVINLDA
jgi:hypothetical protein